MTEIRHKVRLWERDTQDPEGSFIIHGKAGVFALEVKNKNSHRVFYNYTCPGTVNRGSDPGFWKLPASLHEGNLWHLRGRLRIFGELRSIPEPSDHSHP